MAGKPSMRFATLIAALAIVLAACGGSTAAPAASGQAKPTSSPSGAAAKPEKDHIKLVYATASGEQTFLVLASQKAMFQKYGVTVDVDYAQGNTGLAALSSGEAQMNMS